ncbi:ATP-binding cassette domain-containing protein [Ruania alkalisoli]|uniref:ATP-binding cassette domain-containing protein n=1 Tax=Ruania alkalisoli TaxID=2779775 RepID=A0A7M1STY0_9MICO|nr:ATP-binding cassette domain-containing protein [Ruania alkalisoli]QOR71049.1 ATP-binding cassette domain-containing protein [Ruania alkalisoli]
MSRIELDGGPALDVPVTGGGGTAARTGPAVRVENLSVDRGSRRVLDGVSLAAVPGTVTAVIGPNGSGKSTLIGAIAGDVPLADGRVWVAGRNVHSMRPAEAAQRRSVYTQETAVSFDYFGAEIVALGRRPWRSQETAAEREAIVAAALDETEMAQASRRRVLTLSGGERARVQLARVLAQDAAVVLLDEPTAALDLRHQALVHRLCRDVAAAGGTVLVVLHDVDAALAVADQVLLLDEGRAVVQGSPAQVRAEHLEHVYGYPVDIVTHPVDGRRLVLPRRVRH